MKRYLIAAIILLLLCGCTVKVDGPPSYSIHIGDSEKFTTAEIMEAAAVVDGEFQKNPFDCTLVRVTYDEEKSQKELNAIDAELGIMNGLTGENGLVLFVNFRTGENSGPFNPNDLYTDYKYCLVRDETGAWKIFDSGYA